MAPVSWCERNSDRPDQILDHYGFDHTETTSSRWAVLEPPIHDSLYRHSFYDQYLLLLQQHTRHHHFSQTLEYSWGWSDVSSGCHLKQLPRNFRRPPWCGYHCLNVSALISAWRAMLRLLVRAEAQVRWEQLRQGLWFSRFLQLKWADLFPARNFRWAPWNDNSGG